MALTTETRLMVRPEGLKLPKHIAEKVCEHENDLLYTSVHAFSKISEGHKAANLFLRALEFDSLASISL